MPRLEKTERTYESLDALETEIGNARVWGGLHFRNSIVVGEQIGDGIALRRAVATLPAHRIDRRSAWASPDVTIR